MKSTLHPRSRGVLAALVAWVTALAMLAPSVGWAITPYSVRWDRVEGPTSCETAGLGDSNGDPFVAVNQTPVPVFDIPGARPGATTTGLGAIRRRARSIHRCSTPEPTISSSA